MLTVLTAPASNDLTRYDTAVRELRLLREEDLAGLAELITRASMMCAAYCGRVTDAAASEFGAQTVRETFREVYRDAVLLERDINPAVTIVVEDGVTLAAADYEQDGALVYRLASDERVPWAARKVVVTYTTGYTLLGGLPHPIETACLQTLATLIEQRGRDPMLRREDNGLVSLSYMDTRHGLPPSAAALLDPWRRLTL